MGEFRSCTGDVIQNSGIPDGPNHEGSKDLDRSDYCKEKETEGEDRSPTLNTTENSGNPAITINQSVRETNYINSDPRSYDSCHLQYTEHLQDQYQPILVHISMNIIRSSQMDPTPI